MVKSIANNGLKTTVMAVKNKPPISFINTDLSLISAKGKDKIG